MKGQAVKWTNEHATRTASILWNILKKGSKSNSNSVPICYVHCWPLITCEGGEARALEAVAAKGPERSLWAVLSILLKIAFSHLLNFIYPILKLDFDIWKKATRSLWSLDPNIWQRLCIDRVLIQSQYRLFCLLLLHKLEAIGISGRIYAVLCTQCMC